MSIARVLHENRKPLALGLLGLVVCMSGCDNGGGGGSSGPGEAPPPGASSKDVQNAMKNAYGPKGVPTTTKGAPAHTPK